MKRLLILLILLMGLVFPWACSDNHTPSTPSAPALGGGNTATPTGTVTVINATATGTIPTFTPTGTPTPTGAVAFTPTITWTFRPTPAYDNNYGTSAAPNGMYYNGTLYIAEAENRAGTVVSAFEQYANSGGGVLAYNGMENGIVIGQATPCAAFLPTPYAYTITAYNFPVGVAVSSPGGSGVQGPPGMIETLDAQPGSGSATLYAENNYVFCDPTGSAGVGGPFMNPTNGFGGAPFNNPKCLTADLLGHFYVADTGNGYVDEFDGGGALGSPLYSPSWLHRWNGPGSGYPSPSFKKPVAVACDSGNNVYVADAGPFVSGGVNTSVVQIYSSGGTSIIGSFYLIPGCVVNGLATDSAGDFFISDTNNGEVEEYNVIGWTCCSTAPPTVFSQVGLVRAWGDPHGYHELQPYTPSCIGFLGGGYVVSGDSGNDFLNVFGPLL